MRLSEYTDYTLRVLMVCALNRGRLTTIAELAARLRLSKNHLMKVVNDLARRGLLATTRGRGGGLRLTLDPREIRIGDVVRGTETDFRLVECFDPARNACVLTPGCRLKQVFHEALGAYFRTLDGATLADMTEGLVLPPAPEAAAVPQPARAARGVAALDAAASPARVTVVSGPVPEAVALTLQRRAPRAVARPSPLAAPGREGA